MHRKKRVVCHIGDSSCDFGDGKDMWILVIEKETITAKRENQDNRQTLILDCNQINGEGSAQDIKNLEDCVVKDGMIPEDI